MDALAEREVIDGIDRCTSKSSGTGNCWASRPAEANSRISLAPAGTGTPPISTSVADQAAMTHHRRVEAQALLHRVRDGLGLRAEQLPLLGCRQNRRSVLTMAFDVESWPAKAKE